jgi:Ca2+-binding RTX toxin-like protein
VLFLAVLGAPCAQAATVSVIGSTLTFTANAGEANDVTVIWGDVHDNGANLTAGSGCSTVDANSVSCTDPFTAVSVSLGDGHDQLQAFLNAPATVNAGSGNDIVFGANMPTVLHGEGGNDQLTSNYFGSTLDGADGNDTIQGGGGGTVDGGAGDDTLSGGQFDFVDGEGGADTFSCLPYAGCTVDYSARSNPVTVTEDGVADDGEAGENDNVQEGIGDILGGSGNDHITGASVLFTSTIKGNGGGDVLSLTGQGRIEGGPGNDQLTGSQYNDQLDGGTGADVMDGGDGVDLADYGSRTNAVVLNLGDALANDGESGENDKDLNFENILTGSGNDTANGGAANEQLDGGAGGDTLNGGEGNDFFVYGPGDDVLNGGPGAGDTASYVGATGPTVTIDGIANDGDPGEADNVGLDVENLQGSLGNDDLTGSTAPNHIDGSFGNDHVDGGAGDDEVLGSYGLDTVLGGSGNDTATDFDDPSNTVDGGGGDDTVSGRGTLSGGDGNDSVTGYTTDDVLSGDAGDDVLLGMDGNDVLDGGTGTDIVDGGGAIDWGDYSSHTSGVHLDIDLQHGDDGSPGEGDTVKHIENLRGGDGNDVLIGDGNQNTLEGGLGADIFKPGGGFDTVTYEDHVAPVVADLDGKSGDDGSAGEHDTLGGGIEWLVGGQGADVISGSSGANTLSGGEGNDTLKGLAGADSLNGNDGDDTLDGGRDKAGDAFNGGDGVDTADYSSWTKGIKRLISGSAPVGTGSQDKLAADMENIVGGDGNDDLTGDGDANLLVGGPGDDLLDGKDGPDELRGGLGKDRADYSSRTAPVTVDLDGEPGDDGETGEGDTVSADTEGISGGSGNDVLTGNGADNVFRAGDGADAIHGDDGVDLIIYSDHAGPVSVDLADSLGPQGEPGEGDTLDGIENVIGTTGDDVLLGNSNPNWFDGLLGGDAISGRGGFDTLNYASHRRGVFVLTDGKPNDGLKKEGDNIDIDIEELIGTNEDDVFLTSIGRQVLIGRNGDDILDGWTGNDIYSGGAGFDYVGYFGRNKPVHADLDGHADDGQAGEKDVIPGDVEGLAGGNGNDVLRGNRQSNGLAGGPGKDQLTGGAGHDGLFGDAGADTLYARDGLADFVHGGPGSDRAFIDARLDIVRATEALARATTDHLPALSFSGLRVERLQLVGARLHDPHMRLRNLVPRTWKFAERL